MHVSAYVNAKRKLRSRKAAKPQLHLHWLRSERSASAVGLRQGRGWHSRQDFRLQPPRSKRGALYIELREHENGSPGWIRTIALLVQSQALLLLSYGATCSAWRKLEDMLPIPQSGTIRFRGGPGALVRFNFLMHEDGGSQGSRSPIRLRDGSIRFPTGGGSQLLWLPQMAAPGGFAPPTFRFRAGCSTC